MWRGLSGWQIRLAKAAACLCIVVFQVAVAELQVRHAHARQRTALTSAELLSSIAAGRHGWATVEGRRLLDSASGLAVAVPASAPAPTADAFGSALAPGPRSSISATAVFSGSAPGPRPAIDWSKPTPPGFEADGSVNCVYAFKLTGPSAVSSNALLISALKKSVIDDLDVGPADFVNESNTFIIDIKQASVSGYVHARHLLARRGDPVLGRLGPQADTAPRHQHRKRSSRKGALGLLATGPPAGGGRQSLRAPWPELSWLFRRSDAGPAPPAIPMTGAVEGHYHAWSERLAARGGELCSLREGDRGSAAAHCNRRRLAQAAAAALAPAAPAAAPAAVQRSSVQQLDVTFQSREVPALAAAPRASMTAAVPVSGTYNMTRLAVLDITLQSRTIPAKWVAEVQAQAQFLIDSGRLRVDMLATAGPGQQIDSLQLDSFLPNPATLNASSVQAAGLSLGAKAGIGAGAFVAALLAAALVVFGLRWRRLHVRQRTSADDTFTPKDYVRQSNQLHTPESTMDSVFSMRSTGKRSGGKLSNRTSSGPPGSDSDLGVSDIIERMKRPRDLVTAQSMLDGQKELACAVPGLSSDWEIDPREITIMTRPDGTEWELGKGAAGRVFKAMRSGYQVVAVKIFTEQMTEGEQRRYAEAFRREITILRSCHDRNVVQFIGASLLVGQTILVTEFMENGDLYRAIHDDVSGRYGWYRRHTPSGKPVPNTGLGRRIALDIARGLAFLHSRRIVHFDLKSPNILLARDYTAKIADVGLAKILQADFLSTLKEVGTYFWAAPEVLLGKACTEKVDLYSFGVILWELAAGEAPSSRSLRPLRVPEEVPRDVNEMIGRCMAEDLAMRPSALELVAFFSEMATAPSGDASSPVGLTRKATIKSSPAAILPPPVDPTLPTSRPMASTPAAASDAATTEGVPAAPEVPTAAAAGAGEPNVVAGGPEASTESAAERARGPAAPVVVLDAAAKATAAGASATAAGGADGGDDTAGLLPEQGILRARAEAAMPTAGTGEAEPAALEKRAELAEGCGAAPSSSPPTPPSSDVGATAGLKPKLAGARPRRGLPTSMLSAFSSQVES